MLYNKNNVRKTNDKKILHKVGKQWKVVSVALLMAVAGGAVATTHANAQSNNSPVANELNEPQVQAPTSVASAAPSSAASKSANSQSSSAVSYIQNNGGRAASYHAQASNDNSVVNNYVQSLNAKFPEAVKLANVKVTSAKSAEASDTAAANYYNGIASNNANSATVSSLAAKNGLTAKDYANVVSVSEAANSTAVSDAQNSANALSLVASVAKDFAGNDWSVASNVASSKANSLSVKALVFNDENSAVVPRNSVSATVSSFASSVNSSVNSSLNSDLNSLAGSNSNLTNAQYKLYSAEFNSTVNSAALTEANSASISASVEALLANTNASQATSDMTSVASALGVNYASVNSVVSSAVSSEASAVSNYNSVNSAAGKSISSSAVLPTYSANNKVANTSALSYAASNSYAMSDAASVTASANAAIASANAKSALYSNAVVAASAALKSVSSASTELSDASTVVSLASTATNAVFNSYAKSGANSAAFLNSLMSAAGQNTNRKSTVASLLGVNNYDSLNLNSAEKLMGAAMASDEGVDLLALQSDESAVKGVLSAGYSAVSSASAKSGSAFNFSSAASSVENSMAQSASSAVSSATSVSNAYAQSNDTDVVLASSYASSYANDASAEANYIGTVYLGLAVYGAQNGLDTTAYNNAVKDEPNAAKLAQAFGNNVWYNAPKYVTVLKDGLLHKSATFGSKADAKLTKVAKGTKLTVNGVGFSADGTVRFYTTVNGKSGFFTSNAKYAKNTYLFSVAGNKGDYKMLTNARVFKDAKRTVSAKKTVKKGDVLKNASVVSVDGHFGGYTALETANGEFVTANTDCVASLSANNANNGNNTNNNSKPVQHVFFD